METHRLCRSGPTPAWGHPTGRVPWRSLRSLAALAREQFPAVQEKKTIVRCATRDRARSAKTAALLARVQRRGSLTDLLSAASRPRATPARDPWFQDP